MFCTTRICLNFKYVQYCTLRGSAKGTLGFVLWTKDITFSRREDVASASASSRYSTRVLLCCYNDTYCIEVCRTDVQKHRYVQVLYIYVCTFILLEQALSPRPQVCVLMSVYQESPRIGANPRGDISNVDGKAVTMAGEAPTQSLATHSCKYMTTSVQKHVNPVTFMYVAIPRIKRRYSSVLVLIKIGTTLRNVPHFNASWILAVVQFFSPPKALQMRDPSPACVKGGYRKKKKWFW